MSPRPGTDGPATKQWTRGLPGKQAKLSTSWCKPVAPRRAAQKRKARALAFNKQKLAVSMPHLPPTSATKTTKRTTPPIHGRFRANALLPTTSFLQRSPVVVGRPWPGRPVTHEWRDQNRICVELCALSQSEPIFDDCCPSRLLEATKPMAWTTHTWQRPPERKLLNTPTTAHTARWSSPTSNWRPRQVHMDSILEEKILMMTQLNLQKRFSMYHVCPKYLADLLCGSAFQKNGLTFLQELDEVRMTLFDW